MSGGTPVGPRFFIGLSALLAAFLAGVAAERCLGEHYGISRAEFRKHGLDEKKARYVFSEYSGRTRFEWLDRDLQQMDLLIYGPIREYR